MNIHVISSCHGILKLYRRYTIGYPIMIQNWLSLMSHELAIFYKLFLFLLLQNSFILVAAFPSISFIAHVYYIKSSLITFCLLENSGWDWEKCLSYFWPIGYNCCWGIEKDVEAIILMTCLDEGGKEGE